MAKAPRRRLSRIPKGRRADVVRIEFNQLIDQLNDRGELLNAVVHEQQIQLQRIAQLQAELDRVTQKLTRLKGEA
jgi:ABC-type transporter Mla subunit MlaD